MPQHPGEAQRDPARIAGRGLQAVAGDLHYQRRRHVHRPRRPPHLPAEQLGGLPAQHLVGQALERLAQHHRRAAGRVAGREVQVGQPAGPASVPPLGGGNEQVECVPRLHLHPAGVPAAGGVGRRRVLHHDPLEASRHGVTERRRHLVCAGAESPRNARHLWHHLRHRRGPLGQRTVQQVLPRQVQQVEEVHLQGRRPGPSRTHRPRRHHLERLG